ncbi:sugar phosphate isomerase/epimerase family protein [Deinococcus roseus]|uniref:Xylose isomerase n=1 Tax=Deinococcus roseus TaxID=392414 RepID=A0ABQ2D0A8_9DEIO|nr:TIM barrel protein [Deinococcus roseus]GGJ38438.1 hypothetical protein GCM10008938_25690 [Deinococcus roseus]
MELKRMRSLWGVEAPLEEALPDFKTRGYQGIEVAVIFTPELENLAALCKDQNLEVIAQILTAFPGTPRTPKAHLQALKAQVELARPLEPILFNVQGGCDSWSELEQDQFYDAALRYASTLEAPLAFETHRGQPTFTPWTTARILQAFPEMRLTCDLSHWVNVCERLLEDQEDNIRLAAQHCIHIHVRVGYEEGPQVTDPSAPEFATHLTAHEQWWEWMWEAQMARGQQFSTLTPEFGPPGYQHTLPFSGEPVGQLDAICNWMAEKQLHHFNFWKSSIEISQ